MTPQSVNYCCSQRDISVFYHFIIYYESTKRKLKTKYISLVYLQQNKKVFVYLFLFLSLSMAPLEKGNSKGNSKGKGGGGGGGHMGVRRNEGNKVKDKPRKPRSVSK